MTTQPYHVASDRATRARALLAEIDRSILPEATDTQYGPSFWLAATTNALDAFLRSLREVENNAD